MYGRSGPTSIRPRYTTALAFATCGAHHVGVPNFGWDWPVQYLLVPRGERAARVELGPDYCVIDGEWFFVRGCLEVPVRGRREPVSWGAWVSLSREGFAAYPVRRN